MRPELPAIAARVILPILSFLLWTAPVAGAQRVSPEEHGRRLASELRQLRPVEGEGLLRLRDRRGRWYREAPVRLKFVQGAEYWQSVYQLLDERGDITETLIVTHANTLDQPNRYLHIRNGQADSNRMLQGNQANVPFGGSNFWLSDLGLEFAQWPEQRVLTHEMRKGRSCWILESVNPETKAGGYARVRSWIDVEHHAILRAEAFDAEGRRLKEFSVGSVKKVEGQWRLKSMEIRNEQSDERTRIEFDFAVE